MEKTNIENSGDISLEGFDNFVGIANEALRKSPTAIEEGESLKEICSRTTNIYAIWSKAYGTESWSLRYIGQRKAGALLGRLRQHLFTNPKKTGSKWIKVDTLRRSGHEIGVTVVSVIPNSLRTAAEESLIKIAKDQGECEWNIHGRGR